MAETGDVVSPKINGTVADNSHALDGVWSKPAAKTTESALDSSRPGGLTVADTGLLDKSPGDMSPGGDRGMDGSNPIRLADASGVMNRFASSESLLKLDGSQNAGKDLLVEVASRKSAASVEDLKAIAYSSVGRSDLGTKSPPDAESLPNFEVQPHLKCASTSSQWLMDMGMISPKEYKIRVNELTDVLSAKGFGRTILIGDLDPGKFPDGPIGFIVGKGDSTGGNHMGYVEKENGKINVIHNRNGRVVREEITDRFYSRTGKPIFANMSLYRFPGVKAAG